MKVLIYGSTGFVGRYVVKQLINKVEIFLAVKDEKKVKDFFPENIKAIKLTDKIENPIFKVNPDIVINLIGILKESRYNTFEYAHFEIPKRPVIPVPKKAFLFMIPVFSLMPDPIMTLDQYYMLQEDNICSGKYKGVKDLLGSVRDAFVF